MGQPGKTALEYRKVHKYRVRHKLYWQRDRYVYQYGAQRQPRMCKMWAQRTKPIVCTVCELAICRRGT